MLHYQKEIAKKGINARWVARTKVAQDNSQDITNISMQSVFLVESINTIEGIMEKGGCFCISPNYFITCAHIVKKYNKNTTRVLDINEIQSKIRINLVKDNQKFNASVVAIDAVLDIAILQSEINCKPLAFDKNIAIGNDVFAIGSPLGFENNVSFGKIGSLDRKIYLHNGAPKYVFLDLSVFSGNSGGPVIKSDNGKVTAMVTAIVSSGGEVGLNAGLPASYMELFCIKNNIVCSA
jgi:S1-C subfamily serine protease